MYRHSRSSLSRWQALTATPACKEKPATLPGPPVSQSSSSQIGKVWSVNTLRPLRAHRNAVGDGVAGQVRYRVVGVECFTQVELVRVALQQLNRPAFAGGSSI